MCNVLRGALFFPAMEYLCIFIPGTFPGQLGQGSGKLDLVEGVPHHGRGDVMR